VVNVENALGVGSDKSTYRIDGFYRFGETRRHQIDLHYFDSGRSGNSPVTRSSVLSLVKARPMGIPAGGGNLLYTGLCRAWQWPVGDG